MRQKHGSDTSLKDVLEEEKVRTRNAVSTFSFGMLVHVKCIHVSTPIKLWHVFTSSNVRSDVLPPAFLFYKHKDGDPTQYT
jgi:hypothetical protein